MCPPPTAHSAVCAHGETTVVRRRERDLKLLKKGISDFGYSGEAYARVFW